MPRPDTDEVSEEDFNAMLENGGELPETEDDGEDPAEEGVESEEESEDEEEAEDEEEGEEEDEEEESEEETIDWSKLPASAKKAYDEQVKKAQHWEKNHSKLQSQNHKLSQSAKELERTLSERDEAVGMLQQFEQAFKKNPKLYDMLDAVINERENDEEVPDYLKEDPAFKYVQKSIAPMLKNLTDKISHLEKKAGKIDEYEGRERETENRKILDTQLEAAGKQIEKMLGRKATEEDLTKVLGFMVENKLYKGGVTAAIAVFQEDYEEAVRTRHETQMRQKSKKFGTRNKSVNGQRAASQKSVNSIDDAVNAALDEHYVD